jgi:hypothetical protein
MQRRYHILAYHMAPHGADNAVLEHIWLEHVMRTTQLQHQVAFHFIAPRSAQGERPGPKDVNTVGEVTGNVVSGQCAMDGIDGSDHGTASDVAVGGWDAAAAAVQP